MQTAFSARKKACKRASQAKAAEKQEDKMDYNNEKNNRVYLCGEIVSPAVYSHEVFGEGFYEFAVSVSRLSGQRTCCP